MMNIFIISMQTAIRAIDRLVLGSPVLSLLLISACLTVASIILQPSNVGKTPRAKKMRYCARPRRTAPHE
jgi:hypothetical protein